MSDKIEELFFAIKDNAIPLVKHLIEEGVDINIQNKNGKTVLMYAFAKGRNEIAMMLINAGADSKIKDNKGKTCVDYANERKRRLQQEFSNYKVTPFLFHITR